jgi:hypothetical protein
MSKNVSVSQKGLRTPERMFRAVLWFVAVVFAGFLIGLGSLVVRDLPTVDERVELSDFIDKPRAAALDASIRSGEEQLRQAGEKLSPLELRMQSGQAAYDSAKQGFENWIATRQSTQRSDQDPEVIKRTRELDDLAATARAEQVDVEKGRASQLAIEQSLTGMRRDREAIDDAGRDAFASAVRKMEMHVFLIRLAITLPPLAIAAWLFVRHRKSNWWPFVWGFVFFAAFTFFVELVPYLPSYGGYVRYVIGILITLAVGRYAIVAMQRYLERQHAAEQQSEAIRRQSLSYEHAIKSVTTGVCPGCERGFKVHDGETNFCMHCGMKLFEHCPVCTQRRNAFFHYCPNCGVDKPAGEVTPPDETVVTPVA